MSQKRAKRRGTMSRRMARAEAERRRARRRRIITRALQIGIPVAVALVGLVVVLALTGDDETTAAAVTDVTKDTIPPTTTIAEMSITIGSCDDVSATVGGNVPLGVPEEMVDPAKTYVAVIETGRGTIRAELSPSIAPVGVSNFVFLARCGFYDGTTVTRIAKDFVVQLGDPTGTRSGGPGYRIPDELPEEKGYAVGALAYANSGANTSGSQFFIVTGDGAAALSNNYTLFGHVVEGLEVAKEIEQLPAKPGPDGQPATDGEPAEPVPVIRITIEES